MKIERDSITDPVIILRITQLWEPGITHLRLYEATRGVWRTGVRRMKARYALSVADGRVREVYSIRHWYPGGTLKYKTRPLVDVNRTDRWEFSGEIAPDDIRNKYLGKILTFPLGSANPVSYAGGI